MPDEIKGARELIKQFHNLGNIDASKGLLAVAKMVMETSRKNAPEDTGNLKKSHKAVKAGKGAEIQVNAKYAAAVEYGTYKMNAQPYLRPAILQHKKQIANLAANEIEKEIKRKI